MIKPAEALRYYGEVVSREQEHIYSVRDEQPQDDVRRSLGMRAAMLDLLDDGGIGTELVVGNTAVSPLSRPSNYLLFRAFQELRPKRNLRSDPKLVEFTNETLMPLARLPQREDGIVQMRRGLGAQYTDTSALVEAEYVDVLRLARGEPRTGTQRLMRVYHDRDGQPLAFGKDGWQYPALLLRTVDAYGLKLPAGTAVGVDQDILTRSGQLDGPDWRMETYGVGYELTVTPTRLTTLAYDAEADRAAGAVYGDGQLYDQDYAETIASATIIDFQQAAGHVLALCGIA